MTPIKTARDAYGNEYVILQKADFERVCNFEAMTGDIRDIVKAIKNLRTAVQQISADLQQAKTKPFSTPITFRQSDSAVQRTIATTAGNTAEVEVRAFYGNL